MKRKFSLLVLATVFIAGGLATNYALAADNDKPAASEEKHPFMSPEQKANFEKVKAAREKVFANNPELKAEAEALKKDRETLKGGNASPEAKKTLREKTKSHEQKVRDAILKDDPSLAPILAEMDKKREEMKGKMEKKKSAETAPSTSSAN